MVQVPFVTRMGHRKNSQLFELIHLKGCLGGLQGYSLHVRIMEVLHLVGVVNPCSCSHLDTTMTYRKCWLKGLSLASASI